MANLRRGDGGVELVLANDVARAEGVLARIGMSVGLSLAAIFGAVGWTALALESLLSGAVMGLVMVLTRGGDGAPRGLAVARVRVGRRGPVARARVGRRRR